MYNLIRTIFFLIAAYYVIRFIAKYLIPYFRAVTEMNARQKSEQNQYVPYSGNKSSKTSRNNDGEYVDYKEVE